MGILKSSCEFKSICTLLVLKGRRVGLLLFHFTQQKYIIISNIQLIQLPKLFLSNCNLSNTSASIHVLRLLCTCSSENNLPAAAVLGLLFFLNSAQAGSVRVHFLRDTETHQHSNSVWHHTPHAFMFCLPTFCLSVPFRTHICSLLSTISNCTVTLHASEYWFEVNPDHIPSLPEYVTQLLFS